MKKKLYLFGIVLFLLPLFLVPVFMFISPDREFSENENRYLAQAPSLSLRGLFSGEFMEDTEKYMDDQFPLRDFWTSAKTELLLASGSREINGVYICDDGYLIERWDDTALDTELYLENLRRIEALAGRHPEIDFSFMPVPWAGDVQEELLPANAPRIDQDWLYSQAEESLSLTELIDLRPVFEQHREDQLFYRSDHHWTSYGAFLAYSLWAESRGGTVELSDYQVETVTENFLGALYSKVLDPGCPEDSIQLYLKAGEPAYTLSLNYGKSSGDSLYDMEKLDEKDKYLVFQGGNYPEMSIVTENKNGQHLLILKDSFANSFLPFLISDYESIHVIDPRYFNRDLEEYMAEKGINHCLQLFSMKSFSESQDLARLIPLNDPA